MGQAQSCKKQLSDDNQKKCTSRYSNYDDRMNCLKQNEAKYNECLAKTTPDNEARLIEAEDKKLAKSFEQASDYAYRHTSSGTMVGGKSRKKTIKSSKKVKSAKPKKSTKATKSSKK